MKKKSYWLSISVFVLILIWTVYYYAMQYTGGFADLKDSIVCGIVGLICIVFIVKRTIDFLKTRNRKISVCLTEHKNRIPKIRLLTGRTMRKVDGLFLSAKSKKEVNYNDKTENP